MGKIVDDIKAAGSGDNYEKFIDSFSKTFKLRNISNGPGKMKIFGINTIQDDFFKIPTDTNNKIESLNEIENYFLDQLTNSSLGWIGTSASPFCSFYASYLQHKAPNTKISNLVDQQNIVRKLKRIGTKINYPRPKDNKFCDLRILTLQIYRKVMIMVN